MAQAGETAISPFNPGLMITEVVWAIVALFGLWKIFSGPSRRNTATAAGA